MSIKDETLCCIASSFELDRKQILVIPCYFMTSSNSVFVVLIDLMSSGGRYILCVLGKTVLGMLSAELREVNEPV